MRAGRETRNRSRVVFYVILFLSTFHVKISSGAYNVLFIVVDDLRPSLAGYGDESACTPNIDSLIKDGVAFRNAFAQQALCAPSRNSFLTSRRPDTLRLYDFYNYWRDFSGNFTTLPQYFKENSYETRSIGKVFHPGISSNFTDDYPFSWSSPTWHPKSEKFKDSPVCFEKSGWFTNVVCPVRLEEQPKQTLPDIEITEKAVRFLRSKRKSLKRFFLAVGFHKPHIPLKFPRHFLEHHPLANVSLPEYHEYPPGLPEVSWNPWTDLRWRHDITSLNLTFPFESINDDYAKRIKQSYYAAVTYIDSLIGKILKTLVLTSLHKNTIVILLGDHGWSLGEHGEWSKYSNFNVAVRVPLIIRIPGITYFWKDDYRQRLESGVLCDDIVELVDVFPTLVDLAGLKAVSKCPSKNSRGFELCTEGKSLAPIIRERMGSENENQKVRKKGQNGQALSQYPRPGLFPTRDPNSDKPRLRQIKIMGYSIKTHRHRYTEWIEWSPSTFRGNWSNVYSVELYDHFIDPHENLNLAGRPGLKEVEKFLSDQLRNGFVLENDLLARH